MRVGKANVRFAAAHRLHGDPGKCGRLHGHNYRLIAVVRGDVAVNMVIDFTAVKAAMTMVTGELDHAVILGEADPLVPLLREHAARVVTLAEPPTTEAVCRWIWARLSAKLDSGAVRLARVRLWETADSFAEMDAEDARCLVQPDPAPTLATA